MVQQEQNHKKVMHLRNSNHDSVMAFAVSHRAKIGKPGGDRVRCTHCGKIGHEESNCFELVGYPLGWGTQGGHSIRGRGRGD